MIFALIVNDVSVLLAYCPRHHLMPDVCKKHKSPPYLCMVFISPPQYMHENSDPPPLDHYTFLGNCPHTPPQRPTLCPK